MPSPKEFVINIKLQSSYVGTGGWQRNLHLQIPICSPGFIPSEDSVHLLRTPLCGVFSFNSDAPSSYQTITSPGYDKLEVIILLSSPLSRHIFSLLFISCLKWALYFLLLCTHFILQNNNKLLLSHFLGNDTVITLYCLQKLFNGYRFFSIV